MTVKTRQKMSQLQSTPASRLILGDFWSRYIEALWTQRWISILHCWSSVLNYEQNHCLSLSACYNMQHCAVSVHQSTERSFLFLVFTWYVSAVVGREPTEVCVSWQNDQWLGRAARSWFQRETNKILRATKRDGVGEGISADEGRHAELAPWILVKTQQKIFQGHLVQIVFGTSFFL